MRPSSQLRQLHVWPFWLTLLVAALLFGNLGLYWTLSEEPRAEQVIE